MDKPDPPCEAVLLRLARKAAGISGPDASSAAGISKARLSQIENGYEKRTGHYRPVRGKDGTVARLAAHLGVTPAELDEAGRPDAAAVLRVILRRRAVASVADSPQRDPLAEMLARYGLRSLDDADGLHQIWAITEYDEPERLKRIETALSWRAKGIAEAERKRAEDEYEGNGGGYRKAGNG